MGCTCCKQKPPSESEVRVKDPVDGLGNSQIEEHNSYRIGEIIEKNHQNRAWNRSLHKMAMTVIDVSSFDNIDCDQTEYKEKQQIYASRLSEMKMEEDHKNGKPKGRKDISKNLINKGKVNNDDVQLINETAELSRDAVQNAFQIQCNQSIISDFDPK